MPEEIKEKLDKEEPSKQQKREKPDKKAEDFTVKSMTSLASPEALIMFLLAGILDAVGLILFFISFIGIGIPLSFIPDVTGLILIGGWMFLRTGHITTTKKAQKIGKKLGRKILKRLGLAFLGEIIPFFGDIAPCWTLAVYFELKNN